jgi:hypothetical protein
MQRRELFKLLGAGAVVPAFDSHILALFQSAQPKSGYALQTLSAHQNDTLVAMIDRIIPETDTPGAKAVRVNEFIDLILTDWAHDDERKKFLAGLDGVDKRSNELFAKNFVEAAPPQQDALLAEYDQRFAVEREEERRKPYVRRKPYNTQLSGTFFESLKRMTLYGYYTSEVGFTKELGKEIIPGAYHGCAPVAGVSKA